MRDESVLPRAGDQSGGRSGSRPDDPAGSQTHDQADRRTGGRAGGRADHDAATDVRESRRIAVYVNIAKFTLLAALTPPVVVGIAQRAAALESGIDVAALVTLTVSIGSACAVIGALVLGFLADLGSRTVTTRWLWTLASTAAGTLGLLLLALSDSRIGLALGWALAQFGFSGAMAVLRVILAAALPSQRRRGAVVAIIGGYAGMAIPLAVLLILPGSVWVSTLTFALASIAAPLVFLRRLSPTRPGHEHSQAEPLPAQAVELTETTEGTSRELPRWVILLVQMLTNSVLAVFLSYHALEMAERSGEGGVPVRLSVWVIVAAVAGLMTVATVLWARPALLADPSRPIMLAGLLLAVSLAGRAFADNLPFIMLAAALSGCAVAMNSSALFSGALDAARNPRGGRLMGAYSAAGALGQVIGPILALSVLPLAASLQLAPADGAGYRTLFLLLALVPAAWAALLGITTLRRRHAAR